MGNLLAHDMFVALVGASDYGNPCALELVWAFTTCPEVPLIFDSLLYAGIIIRTLEVPLANLLNGIAF